MKMFLKILILLIVIYFCISYMNLEIFLNISILGGWSYGTYRFFKWFIPSCKKNYAIRQSYYKSIQTGNLPPGTIVTQGPWGTTITRVIK